MEKLVFCGIFFRKRIKKGVDQIWRGMEEEMRISDKPELKYLSMNLRRWLNSIHFMLASI